MIYCPVYEMYVDQETICMMHGIRCVNYDIETDSCTKEE